MVFSRRRRGVFRPRLGPTLHYSLSPWRRLLWGSV